MEQERRNTDKLPVCRPGGFALTDRLFSYVTRYRPEWGSSGLCVLDVGCGEGDSVRYLQEKHPGWDVRGVDPLISDTACGRIRRGSAEKIPLPDASADVLLLECVFGKIEDQGQALREFLRVLKPEGLLLISDLYRRDGTGMSAGTGEIGRRSRRKEASAEERGAAAEDARPDGQRMKIGTLASSGEIQKGLEEAGFHILEMQDVSRVLGDMTAQAIMDGTCGELERALGRTLRELKAVRCGYYLCAAERSRLGELLRYAAGHSRFYAAHLGQAGGLPDAGTAPGGERALLGGLPFTTPDDIRREPEALWCVPPKEISRIITLKSSGSTGRPKRIAFTPEDLASTARFFSYGIRSLVRPGDRVMVFMPGAQHDTVGGLLKEGLARLPARVSVYGFIEDMDDAASAAAGMDTLIGVPAQLRMLAQRHPELRPRTVLLSADYVPEKTICQLEASWGCRVFTHWGMSETGYGGGVQCTAREAYHLRDDELITEIIDPATGEVLPDGEEGELVLTTIRRRAMPLIRYRTGDLASRVCEPCPCGCLKPRLGKVTGRVCDAVFPEKGLAVTMPVLDELLGGIPGLADFSATWCEEARRLTVTYCLTGAHEKAENADGAEVKREIRRQLEERLKGSAEIAVQEGEVAPSTGTRKRRILRDLPSPDPGVKLQ